MGPVIVTVVADVSLEVCSSKSIGDVSCKRDDKKRLTKLMCLLTVHTEHYNWHNRGGYTERTQCMGTHRTLKRFPQQFNIVE